MWYRDQKITKMLKTWLCLLFNDFYSVPISAKMNTILIDLGNSKTNDPHRFNLIELRNLCKHISFVSLSIYYFLCMKIIKNIYNHNYFTITDLTLEEEFELDSSYSVVDIGNFFYS